jgi:hypothetical protein
LKIRKNIGSALLLWTAAAFAAPHLTDGLLSYAWAQGDAQGQVYGAAGQPSSCGYGGNGAQNLGVNSGTCTVTNNGQIDFNSSAGDQWNGNKTLFIATPFSYANIGAAHAQVSGQLSGQPWDHYINPLQHSISGLFNAESIAGWTDSLTVSNPQSQAPVLVHLNFHIDGTIVRTGDGLGSANVQFVHDYSGPTTWTYQHYVATDPTSFSADLTAPGILVTPGSSAFYDFVLTSSAILCGNCGGGTVFIDNSTVNTDFGNTLRLTGMSITDTSGNPVSGYTLGSDSGFDYAGLNAASPAPEPSTWLLLTAGLALVIRKPVFRRRLTILCYNICPWR